jgi:hypothetical protein
MTIQLALANSHGIAMASDRHVFRGGEARSTGRDIKLTRLGGPVPAAMMASGPLAVFDVPVARLALPLQSALAAAAAARTPEALAEAVLSVLDEPLPGAAAPDADALILQATAELVLDRALEAGTDAEAGLACVLEELERAAACRGESLLRALGGSVWGTYAPRLSDALAKPSHAAALRAAPELCGRAVVSALTRDWGRPSDLFVTIGLVCPATGVPVLVSRRMWRGLGRRLHAVSRFASDYEALWRSTRTVFVAQGSGRPVIEAMIDGVADSHWRRLPQAERDGMNGEMNERWNRAHDRLGVCSVAELGALAAGLVRGAEAIGFLTREAEGTVAPVDSIVLTTDGGHSATLPSGAEPLWRMAET